MLTCFYEIAGGVLRGIGNSLLPAVMTLIGSCGLRLVWVYTVFRLFSTDFRMLIIIYPITWLVTGVAVLISYFVITKKKYKRHITAE